MDVPKIPTLNISNKALVEMRRNTVAMENFTAAIKSKAGKELLAVIDQYNEVLAIAGTIEDADKYAAKTRKTAEDDAAQAMAAVTHAIESADKGAAEMNRLLDERSAKLTADIATNDGLKGALEGRERLVADRENDVGEVEEKQNKREKGHIAISHGLDARAAALTKKEAELEAWAQRMNAVTQRPAVA